MIYREAFEKGKEKLYSAHIAEADLDARLLLEHVCGTDRNTLLVHGDRVLSELEQMQYEAVLEKRAAHIPLQQITGTQNFMGLDFLVNEHVLIPRQDTEILVEEVLRNLHDGMRILDMCTGSGCILISILYYSNDCQGLGVDLSSQALEIAEQNAKRLLDTDLQKERKGTISFLQSDLFEKVEGKYEIIVSNPPYIGPDVIRTLMPEVRSHEPMMALDGGPDGLDFYRRITNRSGEFLTGGGMLFFEIGYDQAEAVVSLMQKAGFEQIRVFKDYAGLDRVVCGCNPS